MLDVVMAPWSRRLSAPAKRPKAGGGGPPGGRSERPRRRFSSRPLARMGVLLPHPPCFAWSPSPAPQGRTAAADAERDENNMSSTCPVIAPSGRRQRTKRFKTVQVALLEDTPRRRNAMRPLGIRQKRVNIAEPQNDAAVAARVAPSVDNRRKPGLVRAHRPALLGGYPGAGAAPARSGDRRRRELDHAGLDRQPCARRRRGRGQRPRRAAHGRLSVRPR